MNKKMTATEVGKTWAIHMGNTMSICVLKSFLQHVDNEEIKEVVQDALRLSEELLKQSTSLFTKEGYPIPIGLTEEDVNLDAPRLFADPFYLHYLKYTAKAGLSIYSTALPIMIRKDAQEFITYCNKETVALIKKINEVMTRMGMLKEPPTIPIPSNVEFVKKQSYLNGFLGEVRPLHGLEIAHLFDNIENDATSKALLIGFSQCAKHDDVKNFLTRGKDITMNHVKDMSEKLHKEDLPSAPLVDDLVEVSTIPPFSDKLMMTHKIDMFSMKIRTYSNALSLNGRRDIGVMYGKFLIDTGKYVKTGANILIEHGWMEKPPHAVARQDLTSK